MTGDDELLFDGKPIVRQDRVQQVLQQYYDDVSKSRNGRDSFYARVSAEVFGISRRAVQRFLATQESYQTHLPLVAKHRIVQPIVASRPFARCQIERFNRTFKRLLYAYMDRNDTKFWLRALPALMRNYNSSVHSVTKRRPEQIHRDDLDDEHTRRTVQERLAQRYVQQSANKGRRTTLTTRAMRSSGPRACTKSRAKAPTLKHGTRCETKTASSLESATIVISSRRLTPTRWCAPLDSNWRRCLSL